MTLLNYLQSDTQAFIIILFLLGLVVGSFLNVVIYRLPKMMENDWRLQCQEYLGTQDPNAAAPEPLSLSLPASHCPHCRQQLGILENIPVLSYLLQRGRCRHCNTAIAWRYPGVELLSAVLTAYVAWHFGPGWQALAASVLIWALIALTFIDFDTQYLPDAITLPLLWLGLGVNLWHTFTDLPSSVIGAMVGYGSLWSVYQGFKLLTGKEGMGYGDFKLLAALGAWLGWQALPLIIILSSLVGSLVGITLMILKRADRDLKIPFGPYLAVAGSIALIWGQDITTGYLRSIGAG
jgi:leader peptidase (prepilin peptidase) / N-methyltransferase